MACVRAAYRPGQGLTRLAPSIGDAGGHVRDGAGRLQGGLHLRHSTVAAINRNARLSLIQYYLENGQEPKAQAVMQSWKNSTPPILP
ncbi:hypothetical protein FQ186_20485 [Pseudomonas sp. ANT_H14]|nr:hypothetical protein FQ182_14675 [Pseudomonas sp. ANT_H4]KAA0950667.1 hypothetical protein FQ186_20485 [Pseudomonas sp. ANT_H14]